MSTADECYNAFLAIEQETISKLKTKENENRFISETIDFFKSQQTMTNFTSATTTTTTDHKCKVSINDLDSLSDDTLQMIKHNKINEMIKRIGESEFIPKQCILNIIDGKMMAVNRNLSRNKNAITINKDYVKVFENSSSISNDGDNNNNNNVNNGFNALMMMDSSSAENARSVYGYIVYEILYSMENEQERKQIILQHQKRYGINSGHNNTIPALNCFSVLKELKSICKPIDTKILSSTSDLSVLDEGGYGKIVVQMKIPLIKFCNFIRLESTVLCTTEYQREHLCIKVISQDEDSPVTFRVDNNNNQINHKQMYFNKVTKEYERGLCFQPEYHHAKNLKTVWKFDNIFICKETGTVHICGFRCDRMVRSIDYNMICPLTGVIIDDYVMDSKEFKSYVSPAEYKDNQVRYMKDIQMVLNGAYSAAIEEKEKKKIELLTNKKEKEVSNIIKTDSNETMLPMSSPTLPVLKKKKITKPIAKSAPVVNHHKRKKNPEYLIPNSITNIKLIEIHKEQKTVNEIIDNPHQYTRNMDFIKNKRQRPSMMNYSPTSYIKSDGTIDPILYLEHKIQRKSHDMKKSCLAFALKIILNLFSNERFELEEIKNLDVEQMIIRNWQMYEKKCATNDVFTCATDYLVMAENTRNSNPSFMKFNFTIDSRVQLALSYARKVLSLWYILRKNTRMIEDSATTTVTGITHYYFSNFVISAMLMFQNGCVISIMDDLDYERMKANTENISKKRVSTIIIDDEMSANDDEEEDDSDISELDSSKSKIKTTKKLKKKKKSPAIPITKKKKKKRYTKEDGSIFSPYSTTIETSMSPPPILQSSTNTVESNNTLSTINNQNNSIILHPQLSSSSSSSIIVSDILNPSKIQTVVIIKKDELLQNGCLSISNDYIKITKKKKSITRNDPIVEITKQIEHYIQETVQLKLVSYEAFKLEYVDYETIEQKWFMDINAKIVD